MLETCCETPKSSLHTMLAQMQPSLSLSGCYQVGAGWKHLNFIPDFNRLYYILDGEGWVEINGKSYRPQPGQLVIMPCRVRQSYSTVSDLRFRKFWCHFTAKIGEMDLFQLYKFPVCIDVPEKDRREVECHFKRLVSESQSERASSMLSARAALLELIRYFIDRASLENSPLSISPHNEKIDAINRFIEERISEKITLEELAGLVHYHPHYFIRYFHSLLGETPVQYINRMKLERAKSLLLTTGMPMAEVARSVGLETHYFSLLFKKHTGFSPTIFRQNLHESKQL